MSKIFIPTESNPFADISYHTVWNNFHALVKIKVHNGTTPSHYHPDFYELVFVRNGDGINQFDDMGIPISVGNFFLITPGVNHFYSEARDLEIYNIIFGGNITEYFKDDIGSLTNYHLMFNPPGTVKHMTSPLRMPDNFFPETVRMLDEIISEQQNRHEGARTLILSNFLRVMMLMCRHGESQVENGTLTKAYRISQVLTRLNSSFDKAWSLEDMAKLAGMSLSSFRQQFMRSAGVSPGAYLLDLRLRKALAFLMMKKHSVSETANMCGFQDSNYFTRQFRKKYGISPRQLRSRMADGETLPSFKTEYQIN